MNAPVPAAEIAVRAERAQQNSRAYLDLEIPVRELARMAGIANRLASDLLEADKPNGDVVTIVMSDREYEQFVFAIEKTDEMARAVDKQYVDGL